MVNVENVGENIKKIFALIFFYTQDIKNIIFNPKFYQHFLPSLLISNSNFILTTLYVFFKIKCCLWYRVID